MSAGEKLRQLNQDFVHAFAGGIVQVLLGGVGHELSGLVRFAQFDVGATDPDHRSDNKRAVGIAFDKFVEHFGDFLPLPLLLQNLGRREERIVQHLVGL